MASISKIRYTNVVYENGGKRYNDELFTCAGHNTAILLENGGGKTVFIQAALQAVLPHTDLGDRKAKETFVLEGGSAHIAIEWLLSERPRRYGLTAVTLYLQNNELKSYKYTYEYGVEDKDTIENLPFTRESEEGMRAATRVEMNTYYQQMSKAYLAAETFGTTKEFHQYIEDHFQIIPEEWRSITVINGGEGSVEAFFDGCKTTSDLVDKLLLPTVEQGLVGKGSEAFANTFESQREHFNKHKQLERSIRESEKIKEAIESYVQRYKQYHEATSHYEVAREEAKAIWRLIEEKEAQTIKTLRQFEEEKKVLDEKRKTIEKQIALIEVSEAKELMEEAHEIYQKEKALYDAADGKKQEKEKRRHILKLSRFQHNMQEAQSMMKLYEEQLAGLDQDAEVEVLSVQLEENSSYIKGYFNEQLVALGEEIGHCERECSRFEAEKEEQENQKNTLMAQLQQVREQVSKRAGKIEQGQRQMEQIKRSILAYSTSEDVYVEHQQWKRRLHEIEEHRVKLKQGINRVEEERQLANEWIEEHLEERIQLLEKSSLARMQLGQLEKEEVKVLQEVQKVLPVFSHLNSIYLKPQQILTALEEQIDKVSREKEEALLLERQHIHFMEAYAAHDFFIAEPLLEGWIEKWVQQLPSLQIGSAYIANLEDKEHREVLYKQPVWAQRVIVADHEEVALRHLILSQIEKITYPIEILCESQAKVLVEGLEIESGMIYPTTWSTYMDKERFEGYKQEAEKALEEARAYRKQKEKILGELEYTLDKINNFLKEYTHDSYLQQRELQEQLKRQEAELGRELEERKHQLERLTRELQIMYDTLRKEGEEKNKLLGYVEKAQQYLMMQKDEEKEEQEMKSLKQEMSQHDTALFKINYSLRSVTQSVEEMRSHYNVLKSSESRLKDEPLYREVKEYEALYSSHDLAYLSAKQIELKEALGNKQKGRSEIESLLEQSQRSYEEHARNLRQEQLEQGKQIEEIPPYRMAYLEEIEHLTKELNELKGMLEGRSIDVQERRTEFDKKEQAYQSRRNGYEDHYGLVSELVEQTEKVRAEIKSHSLQLMEKDKYVSKQIALLDKELKFILENKQQMDKKDAVYGFCAPEVREGVLEESTLQEFKYELQARVLVGRVLDQLEQLKEVVEQGLRHIEHTKSDFKLFCQQELRDSKLRKMAMQGIMQKETYEDLVIWQENIVERIQQTLGILERDLLDQDQQISQFIIHLYAYLKTVMTELEEIPKKTRVQTEEGWKMIYEFVIPSWQEDSGKEKIRAHIYGLLDDIERDSFLDDLGQEDTGKIKKYIKEQFKLRNLLKVIMGSDAIRVRCRKVSNLNDISSQKYSWETSNKWSGGEKWSKNMALYLGILNYLAEKKQNIQNDEGRISRVVILDNPFGKASSGHVLEPVFFIAKQLGFQIIALTAHSEGDFIRRYFPIVYSCKLRSTMDQRTAIFSKEQEIKKAYFMDNDPAALSILGSDQMSLFNN